MTVNNTTPITFWLRDEVKELERRTPLLPTQIKYLTDRGHKVLVERSTERCVRDEEYQAAGAELVPTGGWRTAPLDYVILGLKELPEDEKPLVHTHVYFAHCYKYQGGWRELLQRFDKGNGLLLDLEFLMDASGRRVAAFGRSAGFIGMAAGLKAWTHQQSSQEQPGPLSYYVDSDALVADVKKDLAKAGRLPTVLVIGALGRCGKGAIDFAERAGLPAANITRWDLAETKVGGPFPQIGQHDIFVNCIYLSQPIAPFYNKELAALPERKLSVVVDVSCDTSNPHNPIPIYNTATTFAQPTVRVNENGLPLDVIAIDHLPSLVPLESSIEFSSLLLEHLAVCRQSDVWTRAEKLYRDKLEESRRS